MRLALERGQTGVLTSEVEDRLSQTSGPYAGKATEQRPHVDGLQRWRERVRMAARRVVAFWKAAGDGRAVSARGFSCVQNGRVAEASFAKGDWAVRVEKGGAETVERFVKVEKETGMVTIESSPILREIRVVGKIEAGAVGDGKRLRSVVNDAKPSNLEGDNVTP